MLANFIQIQQHIARANFTAERGVRYGQDHYDERMQAIRLLQVDKDKLTVNLVPAGSEPDTTQKGSAEKTDEVDEEDAASKGKHSTSRSKDPIRMFGILVPQALRQGQSQAILLVEDIVPELVNVNQEMERVEIEIRRKRKHRAKSGSSSIVSGAPINEVKSTA